MAAGLLAMLALGPRPAHAACNLIPGASQTFRGALATADRPFASPGQFVELRVRPAVCDGSSPGFALTPDDYVVTVFFTPPGGTVNAVVLATDCSGIGTCPGASSTTCLEVNQPGTPAGLVVAT